MDVASAFTYAFQDEKFVKKLLIGVLISIVPIANLAILGYMIQVARNVRDGYALPLPEWGEVGTLDRFGEYFRSGLQLFVINLIYLIPIILLACLQGVALAATGTVTGNQVSGTRSQDVVATVNTMNTFRTIVLPVLCNCPMALWGLFVGVLYPAILVRYADTGQIGAALRIGDVIAVVRKTGGAYLQVVIVMAVVWIAAMILIPITCGLASFFAPFLLNSLIGGHLIGQLAGLQPRTLRSAPAV